MSAFRPIKPKRDPLARQRMVQRIAKATALLNGFLIAAQGYLQEYPPSQSSYRRTGSLGRSWTVSLARPTATGVRGRVGNRRAYAVWVQGPRTGEGKKQRKLFRRRGWRSVTDARRDLWDKKYRARVRNALIGRR